MGKALFNPALYEALKRTKGMEVKQPGPVRTPVPESRVARRLFEAEPARLSLGSQPQIMLGLSATACYLVVFGLFALLAMAFLVGRASVPVTTSPDTGPSNLVHVPAPTRPEGSNLGTSPPPVRPEPPVRTTVTPPRPAPALGPWRIVVYAGRGADRVAELLRSEGLTDVSVAKVRNSLEVHCGHFPSSRAASSSSEFAKIMALTLEGVGFKDAYAKKFE